jgi:hypothetical protein
MLPGKVYLNVTVEGLQSIGTYPFTVGTPPAITTYSPLFGAPGTVLTIRGTDFGRVLGDSYVSAYTWETNTWATWPAAKWSDTEIVVPVPGATPLGKIYLSVTVERLSNIGTYPFTVGVPPQIASYSPTSGPAGTVLTIRGAGFGQVQGGNYVSLQSLSNIWTTLAPTSWSDTEIIAVVPQPMAAGWNYLSVTVGGLQSIGTYPFQVL